MPVRANSPMTQGRHLQRQLWTCAQRSRTRRFHALYDRIYRGDVLAEAGERGRRKRGVEVVVDGDIQSCFDRIEQEKLLARIARGISGRRVVKLIRQWLRAGVMDDGTVRETLAGTPQGGVISPLLANIYLGFLDRIWTQRCSHLGVLVRYAADFVVLCPTEAHAPQALRRLLLGLAPLDLPL